MARYRAAVADAEVAEPGERFERLRAVDLPQPDLLVLMTTWTSWGGYDADVGRELALQREVWVTIAPDMRAACSGWGLQGPALSLRLEQLLGLPPGGGKDRVVELWVWPADLFRPCPDPEITDFACDLDSPAAVSDAHRAWFEDLRARSYGEGGYPWTRLGYTYDWGRSDGEIGLSEFVIPAGSVVKIASVTPQDAYCAPP